MKKLLLTTLFLLGLSTQATAADTPLALIQDTSAQVLELLKKDDGKNTARIRTQVETFVIPKFDFTRMTALAVGRGWRDATPEQKDALAREFQTMLVRTYSGTMTRFKNASVNIKPNIILNNEGREATVKSEITTGSNNGNGSKPVNVDYVLYKTAQGWKVFNVSVEGASLVTVYRNQFSDEIRKNGLDGLIRALQDKNAKLARGASA
ncbi:ABC transporter substrate-binding protein [Aquitalea sp. S1-19]|nr:ABC transporter substrate-binding protein [Aquitalea sp. S1-19]